jgi:hypothetical protein
MTNPPHEVLERWKAAFDGHRPDEMAELFTPDALFQGGGPETVADRDAVRNYYAAVPDNRSAAVTVLDTYTIGDETAGGFADVTFADPDGWQSRRTCRSCFSARGRRGGSASTTSPTAGGRPASCAPAVGSDL